jgi:N4-(beta-N-acetylglucosaminyl)-L-asparaginase
MSVSRRDFIATGASTAAAIAAGASPAVALPSPAAGLRSARPASRPLVIASTNGLRGVKLAYDQIVAGADTLDAIIAGVNLVELDPDDQSVGLGGLPNEEGVVQLDASVMHGPTRRAGAVGCLEDIATPSLVAKAVMDYTDHIMLVGADARRFAYNMGFKTQDLLTEKTRQDWLRWKARLNRRDACSTTTTPCASSSPRDEQQERRHCGRRRVVLHHHPRDGVEGPRARGRLADHWGGAVL